MIQDLEKSNNENISDFALYSKIREENVPAFEVLFKKYYKPLVIFSQYYVKDLQVSENIVQETFLNIWENRKKINITSSVKSYLYTAVKNRSFNHLEKDKKHINLINMNEFTLKQESPHEKLAENETLAAVYKEIENLPEKCRETYMMFIYNELSYSEIAEIQNVSMNTVKTHMYRAVNILRKRLANIMSAILF